MSAISSKALLKTPDLYKYNAGSELEEELGYYNTFFRKYDAQIGRFTGVDILAESTTGLSPFHFGNNNPIMFNDPTGALSDPGTGRMKKGPDGDYHTPWVTEMLWNDKGFFNWGSGMDLNGGGGGSNYSNAMGMSSSSVLNQMKFGDKFGQRKNGDWGFGNRYNFNPSDRGYNNADATDNSLAEVSVGTRRTWTMYFNNAPSQNSANWDNSKLALDIGDGIYGAFSYNFNPGDQWLGKNGKYYNKSWGGNRWTGSRSVALKTASQYKLAGNITIAASAIIGGIETYNGYQSDGNQFGYNAQSAAAQTVGSISGGLAVGILGTKIGAGIGALFGGVGAIPGGIIGGFVGGLLGGNWGSDAGQGAVNIYHGR